MTPERWQQVKLVMTRALAVAPADRSRLLDEVCGNDAALRAEVASLLAEVPATEDTNDSADDSLRAAVVAEARALSASRQTNDVDALRALLQANLAESYDILSTLGVGGMGAVFLAHERSLDRYVAIKTLRADQAVTSSSRERFRREARIAAQLSHPGILPLHTFGETGGMWYLVMGYVRGQSLAQRMHAEGRVAPEEVWRILRALTEALEHAHTRQVIHRDIKPANILIDAESSRPMLADFGISKVLGEVDTLTHTGDLLGTPHFMPPEQIANAGACDERSDIYSLGAVAYAMLSGRAPFADLNLVQLAARRANAGAVPILTVSPSTPSDLAAVVMRCLATRPEDRWANARALRDALDRIDQTADAALSPALREIAGFGAYAVAWVAFWTVPLLQSDSGRQLVISLLLMLLVPMGLALHVVRMPSSSLRRSQMAQVAFWPPMWWGMWWPSALRRPGDIWKLLPWPAKAMRVVMSAFIVLLPTLAFADDWFGLTGGTANADAGWYAALGSLTFVAIASIASTLLWTRRQSLNTGDGLHLLVGSTAPSAFWRRPDIVRLLISSAPGVRPPQTDVPSDYVRAIDDLQRSKGAPVANDVEAAAAMARQIVNAIATLRHEIASLERDAPTSETARLDARLSALEANDAAIASTDDHSALTSLVRNELALLRRLRQRGVVAERDAADLFEVLRGLWTELSRLNESPVAHTAATTRVSELLSRGTALLEKRTAT